MPIGVPILAVLVALVILFIIVVKIGVDWGQRIQMLFYGGIIVGIIAIAIISFFNNELAKKILDVFSSAM
jgi:Flp pilus assembly pilin Flp